jgi:hypothetical protein
MRFLRQKWPEKRMNIAPNTTIALLRSTYLYGDYGLTTMPRTAAILVFNQLHAL